MDVYERCVLDVTCVIIDIANFVGYESAYSFNVA